MNFELYEVRIEDLYENHIAGMNPYNVAPWNIGWHPRYVTREFRNRYYYPRRHSVHWPISRRNMRQVHNPAMWLPLHIRAQNFGRYINSMNQRVEQMQEKTQFLCQLFNEAEAKWNQPFNGDRSDFVDMLREDSKILWQKYKDFDKVK